MNADPSPSSAKIPSWLLIVAIGGIVGIVAGAALFMSGESEPATDASQPLAAATPASKQASAPATSSAAGPKTLASADDWEAEVARAKTDDLRALLNQALVLQDATLRDQIIQMVFLRWMNEDTMAFLDYLDGIEAQDDGGEQAWPLLVPAFARMLPNVKPDQVDSDDYEELVLWMTDYYAEQNPQESLAWARSALSGDTQASALATIAGELSITSLAEAEQIARSLQDPSLKLEAIANIGAVLGEKNPAQALAWARGLTDQNEQRTAVEEVLWSMSESAPESAAQELSQLNDPALLESVGGAIAEELAGSNPSQALQWAESMPVGAAQDEAVSGALSGWAENDPKAAFDYFQSRHAKNADAAEWIFESWAYNSPEEAAAQVATITDPAVRERAVSGVVSGWLDEEDMTPVQNWVDQLPAGRDRDMANATIVDSLSFDDPQPAFDRALTIQDPQIRREAVLSAFSGLVDQDPARAQTVLDSPAITDQEKTLLRSMLQQDGESQPQAIPQLAVPPQPSN